jgi:hypothetical protein
MTPLEKILLLSLRILKTSTNPKISLEQKGLRIEHFNAQRAALLPLLESASHTSGTGDGARFALIAFLDSLSQRKIKTQL